MTNFKDNLVLEGGAVNAFIAIKFLQLITKPFEKWPAFDLGLIDADGKKLKNASTPEEKKEMSIFHIVIRNMKLLLQKIPGGKSKIASYAAGIWLLKEHYLLENNDVRMIFSYLIEWLEENNQHVVPPTINENVTHILNAGKYEIDDGKFIVVKTPLTPFDRILEIDLYRSKNHMSGIDVVFTKDNIKELV